MRSISVTERHNSKMLLEAAVDRSNFGLTKCYKTWTLCFYIELTATDLFWSILTWLKGELREEAPEVQNCRFLAQKCD
jgi:hypothetical protein